MSSEEELPEVQHDQPSLTVPGDLLVDGVYFFVEGLQSSMRFTLLNATGQSSAMRVHMLAAGYLGDTYFLRCRDRDMGNLRDVPAHMLSDIVDEESGEAIDTDDLLNDLAHVAHEVIEAATDDAPQDEATTTQSAPA